jgi:N-carbamoyl-L-amino-acid hydrolase
VPAGMVFVRNQNGSHNPAEAMELDDFLRAADIVYEFLMGEKR